MKKRARLGALFFVKYSRIFLDKSAKKFRNPPKKSIFALESDWTFMKINFSKPFLFEKVISLQM